MTGPAVVAKRAGKPKVAAVTAPPPANDDRKPDTSYHDDTKSVIVTTKSRKEMRLARMEQAPRDRPEDPEAVAEVKAFLARMIRLGGALPPEKP